MFLAEETEPRVLVLGGWCAGQSAGFWGSAGCSEAAQVLASAGLRLAAAPELLSLAGRAAARMELAPAAALAWESAGVGAGEASEAWGQIPERAFAGG